MYYKIPNHNQAENQIAIFRYPILSSMQIVNEYGNH